MLVHRFSRFTPFRLILWLSSGIMLFGLHGFGSESTEPEKSSLVLIVSGIETPQGAVIAAVFSCEEAYDSNDNPCWHANIKVEKTGKVKHRFDDIPEGRYAIKLFHDVNDNQKLDTNWLGIPREPYGFSNNPRIRFGPPSFDTAAFAVDVGAEKGVTVILN